MMAYRGRLDTNKLSRLQFLEISACGLLQIVGTEKGIFAYMIHDTYLL